MKMVSQLTRRTLNRHSILSSDAGYPAFPPPSPDGLFVASAPQPVPPPISAARPVPPPPAPAQPQPLPSFPRSQGIYSQLMKNHDRMTERHLKNT